MRITPANALIAYSAVLTAAFAVTLVPDAAADQQRTAFDEIDVKRINLREEDGTLRMVISNTDRLPGIIIQGEEHPHPNRRTAGILFFNDEGTENGGLTFGGKTGPDGKVSGSGHLSFDQYEQDQVIQLTQSEYDGSRYAAMIVSDRPDERIDLGLAERITSMPEGAEKDALIKKAQDEGTFGRQRLFAGKTRARESAVLLSDAMARPRLLLKVTPEGAASIDFLDEAGKVVKTLRPEAK